VSGGSDSLIVFWDMYELLSSGTISTNDYQVRKLNYNSNGDYLAAIFYDEILKKW
jgi:WD40 repeat protein